MAETKMATQKNGTPTARWDPFVKLDALQDEMARWWGQAWPLPPLARPLRLLGQAPEAWTPRVDVFEKDGKLVVKAELPGVTKEDVQVMLDQGDLVITGERKAEQEVKEGDYYRMERSYGTFMRRLPLPFEPKPDEIEATFANGVLEVKIPKPAVTTPTARTIPIA